MTDLPAATAALPESSTRILILGLDCTGRILHCDRNAASALSTGSTGLVGKELGDVLAPGQQGPLDRLLDNLKDGREGAVMLTVNSGDGTAQNAIVSVHPMNGSLPTPAAVAIVRVAVPNEERFRDPAVMRRALLDDSLPRIGAALDLDQTARGLMSVLIPHFCNAGAIILLESVVGPDDDLPTETRDGLLLRRMAIASDDNDPRWEVLFPSGEILTYPAGIPHLQSMETGQPVLTPDTDKVAAALAGHWQRPVIADALRGASMLTLPLVIGGTPLGVLVCMRYAGYRQFDRWDAEIGMDFAGRASLFVDGARRYSRERATALTLQRSLLPTGLSAPASVEVHHRYLPGGRLIEVGGDWYESIALPGARVALVVGDVAGHGVKAAVTMGRLRTAIHTLAGLDLPPAEALERLDGLMRTLGEREPHFATCAYVVYDAVTGTCEAASAGHLPPLLAPPGGPSEFLDVPPAPPLGVGGGTVVAKAFTVEDDTLLTLYTDGLVENRGQDIDDGLDRLRGVFGADASGRPLRELCQEALDGVGADHHRDDIAVLIARLRRIPADDHVCWELPAEPAAVRRARGLVRERLRHWGLEELEPATAILVSELVTNAIRYVGDPIRLRLVREHALVCEVFDSSDARPRVRHPGDGAESGRGLHVVSRLARRWGVRSTSTGKVVWCEQDLP